MHPTFCCFLQRSFLTAIEKAITAPASFSSSNKVLVEIAVVCGVELTKACTYINDHNNTVFRYYVALLQNSLHVSSVCGPYTPCYCITLTECMHLCTYVHSHSVLDYELMFVIT